MPLFNRDKGRRERLLLFNREGDKLRDNNASKINNEVISDKLGHAYDAPLVPRQLYLPVGVNQFCRFTSLAWTRCWAALVR